MARLLPLMQTQNNNLRQRILTIVLTVPLTVCALLKGSPYADVLVIGMLAAMLWEWSRMSLPSVSWPILSIALGMWCFLTFYGILTLPFLFSGLVALLGTHILCHQRHSVAVQDRLIHLLGILYISLASYILMLWLQAKEPLFILWLLLIIWTNDTGAYIVGRILGGPKLAPRISPKKTWSGLIGGILLGTIAGTMTAPYLISHAKLLMDYGTFAILGGTLMFSLCAHAGDLLESQAKRYFRVKDSGSLFPGHGGVLDRLDSTLMVLLASGGLLIFYPQLF